MDISSWVGVGVGALGGGLAFFARRDLAKLDDVCEKTNINAQAIAVLRADTDRNTDDIETVRQRGVGAELEIAALKERTKDL